MSPYIAREKAPECRTAKCLRPQAIEKDGLCFTCYGNAIKEGVAEADRLQKSLDKELDDYENSVFKVRSNLGEMFREISGKSMKSRRSRGWLDLPNE